MEEGKQKSKAITAIIAAIFGLAGFFGIGHIYIGEKRKGMMLLVVGIVLATMTWIIYLLGFVTYRGWSLGIARIVYIPSISSAGDAAAGVIQIILLILWIWQITDSYSLAKKNVVNI